MVVCGIATNICCFFAARDLRAAGFDVWMVEDASAGIDVPAAGLFQAKAKAEGEALGSGMSHSPMSKPVVARNRCRPDSARLRWAVRLQSCPCPFQDHGVIEGQGRQVVEREPADGLGIISCHSFERTGFHLCQIATDNRPATRIAAGITGSIQLLQLCNRNASLLLQFPSGGVFKSLVFIDETPWHCPTSGKWLVLATDQKNPGTGFACRYREIHCQGRSGVIVTEPTAIVRRPWNPSEPQRLGADIRELP